MWELEEAIAKLENENSKLKSENVNLRKQTVSLSQENTRLKSVVKVVPKDNSSTAPAPVAKPDVVVKDEPGFESAALAVPQQKELVRAVYEVTSRVLAHLLVMRFVCAAYV
jgi:regulator of replication initiation timing